MNAPRPALFLALLSLTTACSCVHTPPAEAPVFAGLTVLDHTNGLSAEERERYYHLSEGISYLPIDVLRALRRPVRDAHGSPAVFALYDEPFLARPQRFGLIPQADGLPIGLAVAGGPDRLAGLNCATCHTALLTKVGPDGQRVGVLVDGAAGQFAVDRFIAELTVALLNTLYIPGELARFDQRYRALLAAGESSAVQVPPGDVDELEADALEDDAEQLVETHDAAARHRVESQLATWSSGEVTAPLTSRRAMRRYLAGRLRHFLQETAHARGIATESGLGRADPWLVTKRMMAANLPGLPAPSKVGGVVGTPHFWGFTRSKWIFRAGVTTSMLERNVAQGVALVSDFDWRSSETSVTVRGLGELATYAERIREPRWPSALWGAPDRAAAARGALTFSRRCLTCHDPLGPRDAPEGTISANACDVGTDPAYVASQRDPAMPAFFPRLAEWIGRVKSGAFEREALTPAERATLEKGRPSAWRVPAPNHLIARPLYGIWATGPYLHNNSVRTLRDLLRPAARREREFFVGSTDLDPRDLGFVSDPEWPSAFHFRVSCDDTCGGNGNGGHEEGTDLSETEKDELLEFLKTYTSTTVLPEPAGVLPAHCARLP